MSSSSRVADVFVPGLGEHNREVLESLPDSGDDRFHGLLSICAAREPVVTCEHKCRSRLEQQKVIDEYPAFGVVDTVDRDDVASQDRFQCPSSLPAGTAERMVDISRRIVRQVGLDDTTFTIEFFWDADAEPVRALEVNPRRTRTVMTSDARASHLHAYHGAERVLSVNRSSSVPRDEV